MKAGREAVCFVLGERVMATAERVFVIANRIRQ